jgi:mediator of RNA polymerase II transcription subunit 4
MNAILSQPLADLHSLSQSLFQSLSPAQSKPPPPPPISSFLACDAALANAIHLARVHQNKQRQIEKLKKEVLELDENWREICAELEGGKRELEGMIEEGEIRCKAIEEAKNCSLNGHFVEGLALTLETASIPYPELLAYAQSLSAFTSAPPNMPDLSLPGQPPPPLFFPPFPNEEKMRRGRLNAEAPLGPPGEIRSVGRREFIHSYPTYLDILPWIFYLVADSSLHEAPTMSPKAPDIPPAGSNIYRQDARPQQIFDLDLDLNPDL